MPLIVKTVVQAARRDEQSKLDQEIEEAGIIRVPSTIKPYFLTVYEDLDLLTELSAAYRTKPRVVEAALDDVPAADETGMSTEDLTEFVHRAGYLFVWDEDTMLWCVSGVRDGFPDQNDDVESSDQRSAVLEAIRYLVE